MTKASDGLPYDRWPQPARPLLPRVGVELAMFRFLEDADPRDVAAVAGPGAVVRATEHGLEVVVGD